MKKKTKYAMRKRRNKKIYRYRELFLWALLVVAALYFLHAVYFMPNMPGQINDDGINIVEDNIEKEQDINNEEIEWNLILVNKYNYIPEDYEVELTELANGQCVDERIYPALQSMFDEARREGVYPVVASGYRTSEKQQSLLDEKIQEYLSEGYTDEEAKSKAEAWVAVPGTSEHQLGLGIDINADGIHSTGNEVYEWLNKNSYKFGFINRYPKEKTEITGIINEPWHYRYVGIEAATEIYKSGICLEEYLDK